MQCPCSLLAMSSDVTERNLVSCGHIVQALGVLSLQETLEQVQFSKEKRHQILSRKSNHHPMCNAATSQQQCCHNRHGRGKEPHPPIERRKLSGKESFPPSSITGSVSPLLGGFLVALNVLSRLVRGIVGDAHVPLPYAALDSLVDFSSVVGGRRGRALDGGGVDDDHRMWW